VLKNYVYDYVITLCFRRNPTVLQKRSFVSTVLTFKNRVSYI